MPIVTGATSTCACVQPGTTVPPPSAVSSDTARAEARSGSSRSTPRSNRAEASLNSRCRRLIRAVPAMEKCAASMTRSALSGVISVASPPIVPASEIGPDSSVIRMSSGSRARTTWSRVSSCSPGRARRTTIGPVSADRSNACSGWPSSIIR